MNYVGEGEDHDPHWTHEHRGSIGGSTGLEAAQKLDPIYDPGEASMKYTALNDIHQHRGSIGGASGLEAAEKLDPPQAVRGPGYSQTHSAYHRPTPCRQSSVLSMLDAELDSDSETTPNRAGTHTSPRDNDRYKAQSYFPDKPQPGLDKKYGARERRKSREFVV